VEKQNLGGYFKEEGHLNDEAIALFSDALILKREEMLDIGIRNHVENCQQCRKEVFAIYEIMKKDSVVQGTTQHPLLGKPETDKKTLFRIHNLLKIAAVLLVFFSISGLIYTVFTHPKNLVVTDNQTTHTSDTTNKHNKDKIAETDKDSISVSNNEHSKNTSLHENELAVNLEESPIFEGLIASHYRSNDIEVSFPPLNHQFAFNEKIEFKLNGNITESVVLFIYSNKGEKIAEKNNISVNSTMLNKKLPTGLYYWKLIQDDNLLQAGKFFVK